jgi:hypothetical protein
MTSDHYSIHAMNEYLSDRYCRSRRRKNRHSYKLNGSVCNGSDHQADSAVSLKTPRYCLRTSAEGELNEFLNTQHTEIPDWQNCWEVLVVGSALYSWMRGEE